jgi:fatty acid-binding protein DegV
MKDRTNGSEASQMESELIAIGVVLLVVAAVLLVAVGAPPTPLDLHIAAVRADTQVHVLVSAVAQRLPH